jgi:hypothetical protein
VDAFSTEQTRDSRPNAINHSFYNLLENTQHSGHILRKAIWQPILFSRRNQNKFLQVGNRAFGTIGSLLNIFPPRIRFIRKCSLADGKANGVVDGFARGGGDEESRPAAAQTVLSWVGRAAGKLANISAGVVAGKTKSPSSDATG